MRVMIMVKASKESEAGIVWADRKLMTKVMAEMGKINEELLKAGVLLAAEGLQPSSKGVRVRFSRDRRTVIDGPFSETKELVAGFSLWEVKSMEEAIEWVKRYPNCMPGGGLGDRDPPGNRHGRLRRRDDARTPRKGAAPAGAAVGREEVGAARLTLYGRPGDGVICSRDGYEISQLEYFVSRKLTKSNPVSRSHLTPAA
jgi:hypothetical protein